MDLLAVLHPVGAGGAGRRAAGATKQNNKGHIVGGNNSSTCGARGTIVGGRGDQAAQQRAQLEHLWCSRHKPEKAIVGGGGSGGLGAPEHFAPLLFLLGPRQGG